MNPTPKWKEGRIIAHEQLAKQVGALLAAGSTQAEVAKELKLSVNVIKRLSNLEQAKRVMIEIGEVAVDTAKRMVKAQTAGMTEEVIATLKFHLKNKNLNAIPHALKILGFGEEKGEDKPATFTIVMPGAAAPKDITPDYSEVDLKTDGDDNV